jgi:hypothetical protein
MAFMHDPTLQVTDNAEAGWKELCPELNLQAELKEQPWTLLHDRPEDKRLGSYWLLPCGIVAVIKKTLFLSPKGKLLRTRLRLVKFLAPKQCKKALKLPEPKVVTITPEQYRREQRSSEKRRRKRRQARKQAEQACSTPPA